MLLRITSPALLGSDSFSGLQSFLSVVLGSLSSAFFSAHWPAPTTGAPAFAGLWLEETEVSQEKHEWVAEIGVVIGISV
jgi:hypothetical protein